MTVSFGRVGVPAANCGDGLVMLDPFEVVLQGREMTISGYWRGTTALETVWVRDQILGLSPEVNTDEAVVPFVFTDTNSNGYYRITSVSCGVPRGSLGSGGLFHFDWQITATRAIEFRRSRIEVPFVYAQRANNLALITGTLTHAVPNESQLYKLFNGAPYTYGETTSHGDTRTASFATSNETIVSNSAYSVDPQYFYKAGARIETAVGGGTYLTVVGRRDIDNATWMRATNGLIRVTVASSTTLVVEGYVSGAWTSSSTYSISNGGVNALTFIDATVLKNSPEEIIVRLWASHNALAQGYTSTVDIVLRRGQRVAGFFCSANWSPAWRLAHSTAVAHTAVATYGIRRTATLNSNYTVMMSDYASTQDLVNGSLSAAVRPKCTFGVGVSNGSVTTDIPGGAAAVGQTFWNAVSDSQRIAVG